ncbi:zinc finger protein 595-like isoform X2 [Dermacentor albipictus]|uniref:zinc finger protein 595-like isoform X2 n=1 Tax=Dermacentor albipictus TaxID=60249 RepID=UPI0038FC1887
MTEISDELTGQPFSQNIRVYVNVKTDAFCTDLIFPFGIPANGVISVFVGDFSASYSRECCEHPEAAEKVINQKLVVMCRPHQGKPTCVPVPCPMSSEGDDVTGESNETTVPAQDFMEPVWKEAKSTNDRLTVSAAHLRVPGTELEENEENDGSFEMDIEEFTDSSPVSSVGDANALVSRSECPDDTELPHIIDVTAPAFHLFSSSEEPDDDSPCLKQRKLRRRGGDAAVSSSVQSSICKPLSDYEVDEFVCAVCNKSFPTRPRCQRHVWSHLHPADSILKSFKCPACIKAFSSRWALRFHYKAKHLGRKHVCSHCDVGFDTSTALSLHVRRMHTVCLCVYTCEYCLHMFERRSAYNMHVASKHEDGTVTMLSSFPEVELRCSHCPSFITSSDLVLTRHLQSMHPDVEAFGCRMCSLVFQEQREREEHEQTVHTVKLNRLGSQCIYFCRICDKAITTLSGLACHLRVHLGQREKLFLCPTCGAQLATATTLRIHMMLHEESPWLQCPHCPRQFHLRIYLRKHLRRAHNAHLRRTCSHCGKKFVTTKEVCRHLATVHISDLSQDEMALLSKLKKYSCELCPFETYSNKGLHTHMSNHPEARWLKCSRCPYYYPTEAELLAHEARSHKTAPCKRPCPLCPRIFYSKALFDEHTKLHADGNGLKCLHCDKVFRTIPQLERHTERHDPTLTQRCGDCGRTFSSIQSLQVHQHSVHKKRKRLQSPSLQSCRTDHRCPHCQQQFQCASGLQAHKVYKHDYVDTPSGSKLPCPLCGRMCSSEVAMSVHLRIHLNERPYVCELCDKKFISFAAAKAHSARHLTMHNFECSQCGKQLFQRSKLDEHIQLAHSVSLGTELSVTPNAGQLEVIEEEAVVEMLDHSASDAHSSMPQPCHENLHASLAVHTPQ